MRYVIIGSGIAGISAAKSIRQHAAAGDIRVYTNEAHPVGLYARKDMARWLATGIPDPGDLLLEGSDALSRQGIYVEYENIERVFSSHQQILKNHAIRQPYDRLLLATGAAPQLVNVPGLHYIGVHQARNYEDFSLIENWIPPLREVGAVIVGGGILGLDMAYALKERGVPVTLVVREHHVGAPFLPEAAARLIEHRVQRDGIELILGQTLSAYLSEDDRVLDGVQLSSGRIITARMALCTVGVYPNTDFLEGSGIEVDEVTGAISVNTFLQTNLEGIYAAGSCALVNGQIAHNWLLSAEQGRIAGLNMVGHKVAYETVLQGDLNTRFYDLPFAYFGQNRPASPDIQLWSWEDGSRQFAQILLDGDRMVGATLLGDIVEAGAELFKRYRAQAPTSKDDLQVILFGVRA